MMQRTGTALRQRLLSIWCALALALAALATGQGPALAQQAGTAGTGLTATQTANETAQSLDYDAWERVAQRAEGAIEANRASTAALEDLRAEIVGWRETFTVAQDANANAIATVESQLRTLGDPPAEGGTEPEEVAAERETLNARLTDLRAPVRKAELARSRADGIITGIDGIIRERQTDELLQIGPSPLIPANWAEALATLVNTFDTTVSEVRSEWANPLQKRATISALGPAAVLALIGLVLLLRGRRWVRAFVKKLTREAPNAGRWITAFVVSLGEIILPYVGVVAIVSAIMSTGLVGLRSTHLLDPLANSALLIMVAHWLARRIFPDGQLRMLPLDLSDDERGEGRIISTAMGWVIGVLLYIGDLSDAANWSEASRNVILFPVLVIAALLLVRLSRLLLIHAKHDNEEDAAESFRDRMVRLLARGLVVIAVAVPVLAAIGYFRAAEGVMRPTMLSLLLLGGILVLQRVVTELYVLISGNREDAGDSLVPVMAGFGIILLSVPVFALIWGARTADLLEMWVRFREGFTVGDTTISPTVFITLVIVFVLGLMVTRLIQGALKNTVLPKTKLDQGGKNAVVSGVGYIGIFLAALIAITSAGIDLSSIAIVAGALSVGIGFGLQNIVSNFVSGIILLIERPISEGDWIEVGPNMGIVKDISVRSTRIETFDRTDVIVPNADLVSGTVTNYTRGKTVGRIILTVGVAYGTDTRKVERILYEVGESHPMVLANPGPLVVFQGFGADSLDFDLRLILRDIGFGLGVRTELNHKIAERFAEEGIEIPYAQRDIWIRNPEALPGAVVTPPQTSKDPQGGETGKRPDAATQEAHLTQADMDDSGEGDGGDGDAR